MSLVDIAPIQVTIVAASMTFIALIVVADRLWLAYIRAPAQARARDWDRSMRDWWRRTRASAITRTKALPRQIYYGVLGVPVNSRNSRQT